MSWAMVIPVVDHELGLQCVSSIDESLRERVCVVNNAPGPSTPTYPKLGRNQWSPEGNIGVAASWNVGVDFMRAIDADVLWIASSSVHFTRGATDLDDRAMGPSGAWAHDMGWHLVALTAEAFDRCGLFDEGFWPAYWEDTDFSRRMRLTFLGEELIRPTHHIGAKLLGIALSRRVVDVNLHPNTKRYLAKWGGTDGYETFATPWNSGRPVTWCGHV